MMIDAMREVGTMDWLSERFKMFVNTSASLQAPILVARPVIPYGSEALWELTFKGSRQKI